MTMVTAVSYADLNWDDDGVFYRVYVVPSEDYNPGMPEEMAAALSTQPVKYENAPGFRGAENVVTGRDGNPAHATTTCGVCGRVWDDGLITDRTPTPSARCPWEHLHGQDDDTSYEQREIDRVTEDGPDGSGHYRIKIWGAGGNTRTLSITADQLDAVRAILTGDGGS